MTANNGRQAAVQLRPPGQSLQFTPFGVAAIGETKFQADMPLAGSLVPLWDAAEDAPVAQKRSVDDYIAAKRTLVGASLPVLPSSATTVSPKSVISAAKARIKELRVFLREAKKAEKELRELERLVEASKKPLAAVRDIRRSAG